MERKNVRAKRRRSSIMIPLLCKITLCILILLQIFHTDMKTVMKIYVQNIPAILTASDNKYIINVIKTRGVRNLNNPFSVPKHAFRFAFDSKLYKMPKLCKEQIYRIYV